MKNFELIFYQVSVQGNDYLEKIYEGIDFYRAKREYDSVGISDFQDDYGGVVMLEKSQKTFRYVYDLDDLEDFPIEKYYAESKLYEELDSTEPEIVFQREIDYINKESDELLSRVQDHYFEIYGEYKYNNIPVTNDLPEDDENFVEFGCIQLRLADHSENLQNIDRFGVCIYYISVVIAEKNATKDLFFSNKFDRRKNEIELHFDSDANFETIVSEIDQKIENGKQIVRMKYNQENQIELGRGGRITQAQENMPKFAKIGISDKYEIEAIIDIGLAGVKFTKEGVQEAIKNAYNDLAENVSEYVVSEVSQAIVNVIINEMNVQLVRGASLEVLEQYEGFIESESAHLQYLNKFAEAQKSTLAEWVNYLNQSEYPYAFRYLILRSVLLDNYDFKNDQLVKRNKKTIRNFTAFDAGTLAQLFSKESDYLLKDFSILQLENIERIVKAKEIAKASGGGTWLKFNGGSSTPEAERRANATELMQLVQDTYWCTKTNARGQLNGGDFYVYVTESEGKKFPRIAIRMDENKVGEVRGNASAAQDLEPEMIPIAESFLEKNFQDESGKKWLESVRYNKRAYNLYLKVLEEEVFEGFVEEFIDLKKDEKRFTLDYSDRNGHIQRSENYLNENKDELRAVYGGRVAMGVNEFNPNTTEIIIGDADFEKSKIQNLGNLQTIGGKANFKNSKVITLGNLQTIGGSAYFENSEIRNLGNLQTIGGNAYFGDSQVQDLGNLQTIGGYANFENSKIESLGNLQTIGGYANFENSKIESLGNLQTIGRDAYFNRSQIQTLGNLQTIGGAAYFWGSQIQTLGNLQTIGRDVSFRESRIQSLGNLQKIGGDANFIYSQVQSLGNLQTIGGSAFFRDSQIQDLGNLQTIGDYANFSYSQVQSLGNLKTIGRDANFEKSQVQSLGNLQTIGGEAFFRNSQVQDLGNLQTIGGSANFVGVQVQDLGNLQTIEGYAKFSYSQVQDLGNLQTIGGDADFGDSQVQDLGNLQTIRGKAWFDNSKVQSLGNLKTIGGNAIFGNSQVQHLGNLQTIRRSANFSNSQVQDLGNLQTIGGDANFFDSQVQSLGNLKTIGGNADFGDSQVQSLGNLQTIGGMAYFRNRTDLEAEWEAKQKAVEMGRGGRITQAQENMPKFAKIGISDKYEIEAIIDIGLAGVKFTKEGVQDAIKNAYTELANSVNQYVISEVSQAIVNVIINEMDVQLVRGASLEVLERYVGFIESESAHLQYLNKFAEAQKSTLAEWVNYLNQSEYPYAFRYLILRSVLLDNYDFKNDQLVKRNKKTIRNFTPFDAGTLAELFTKQSDYLLKDFSILQLENIERIVKAKEIAKVSGGGTWLKFNGGSSTPEAERRANATELMQLVQDTYWCTKTNASGQLDGGDFYVYVTESEDKKFPRIAIRMDENKVGEVRGNASAAQDLEPEMIPIAESFLEKNFQDESGKKWLESVRYNKRAYNLYLKVLEEGVFEGFVEEFIDLKKDEKRFTLDYSDRNGHIQRSENYLSENKDELRAVYGDSVAFDINEFNPNTTEIIIGDADFKKSQVQDLGNLQTIGGTADFNYSQVQSLGNLQTIGGRADFRNSQVKDLGNLQTIGGRADFRNSQVQSLGNLQTIGGWAYFRNSQVKDLGNLQTIGGDADFRKSKVQSLGNLQRIGGDADFNNSQVQRLGNLQTIGRYADFQNSKFQDLGNLQTIGGNAYFGESQVQDLGNLKLIGGSAYFERSQVQDLGNLQTIEVDAYFKNSQVQSLGNLQTIGGTAFFNYSQVQSLGNLQTIGRNAYLENSQVQSLGNLQTIEVDAYFKNSQVQSLGNLQTIGGNAFFEESQVQNLGNLQTIGRNANFSYSQVRDLGNLQTIEGDANFQNSQVKNLGNLQTIGGNAYFGDSQVQDLGNLQTIEGDANFQNSQVRDLRNLQTILGNTNFVNSKIQSLGNLQTIRGDADFSRSKIQDLGNLQTIGGDAYFNRSKIQSLGNLKTIRDAYFGNRTDLKAEWEEKQKAVEMGRGGNVNPSKTPAPIKERIYGSKINKPESSASLRSASTIKLSPENISTLNKKVLEFKSKYVNRNKKMTLNAVKAVMRRGMGAFSSTHRPTISGGKPNSRVAWGLARVNAFLYKAEKGIPKNPKYLQDDDLLRELGYKIKMFYGGLIYEPQLNEFDELELAKGGEISPNKFVMPSKEILEYGQFLKEKHPEVWKAGGNIFGNQAFENLKKVSKRGYWLESERWMYDKWQSFVKRHQHNHQLAGVVANVKWASWGNIGKAEAKSVIENAFSKN